MEIPFEWQLDPGFDSLIDSRVREKAGWKGDHKFQFNGPQFLHSQITDFVAKCDYYTNATEFCNNALFWYYDRVLSEMPDGYGGILRAQHEIDVQQAELIRREVLLNTAKALLSDLRMNQDVVGLRSFCANMEMHLSDLEATAPEPYLSDIRDLITEAQRTIRAYSS